MATTKKKGNGGGKKKGSTAARKTSGNKSSKAGPSKDNTDNPQPLTQTTLKSFFSEQVPKKQSNGAIKGSVSSALEEPQKLKGEVLKYNNKDVKSSPSGDITTEAALLQGSKRSRPLLPVAGPAVSDGGDVGEESSVDTLGNQESSTVASSSTPPLDTSKPACELFDVIFDGFWRQVSPGSFSSFSSNIGAKKNDILWYYISGDTCHHPVSSWIIDEHDFQNFILSCRIGATYGADISMSSDTSRGFRTLGIIPFTPNQDESDGNSLPWDTKLAELAEKFGDEDIALQNVLLNDAKFTLYNEGENKISGTDSGPAKHTNLDQATHQEASNRELRKKEKQPLYKQLDTEKESDASDENGSNTDFSLDSEDFTWDSDDAYNVGVSSDEYDSESESDWESEDEPIVSEEDDDEDEDDNDDDDGPAVKALPSPPPLGSKRLQPLLPAVVGSDTTDSGTSTQNDLIAVCSCGKKNVSKVFCQSCHYHPIVGGKVDPINLTVSHIDGKIKKGKCKKHKKYKAELMAKNEKLPNQREPGWKQFIPGFNRKAHPNECAVCRWRPRAHTSNPRHQIALHIKDMIKSEDKMGLHTKYKAQLSTESKQNNKASWKASLPIIEGTETIFQSRTDSAPHILDDGCPLKHICGYKKKPRLLGRSMVDSVAEHIRRLAKGGDVDHIQLEKELKATGQWRTYHPHDDRAGVVMVSSRFCPLLDYTVSDLVSMHNYKRYLKDHIRAMIRKGDKPHIQLRKDLVRENGSWRIAHYGYHPSDLLETTFDDEDYNTPLSEIPGVIKFQLNCNVAKTAHKTLEDRQEDEARRSSYIIRRTNVCVLSYVFKASNMAKLVRPLGNGESIWELPGPYTFSKCDYRSWAKLATPHPPPPGSKRFTPLLPAVEDAHMVKAWAEDQLMPEIVRWPVCRNLIRAAADGILKIISTTPKFTKERWWLHSNGLFDDCVRNALQSPHLEENVLCRLTLELKMFLETVGFDIDADCLESFGEFTKISEMNSPATRQEVATSTSPNAQATNSTGDMSDTAEYR